MFFQPNEMKGGIRIWKQLIIIFILNKGEFECKI